MTRIDHTGHDHPATPAARAACRKALAAGTAPVVADVVSADDRHARNEAIKVKGLMAAKLIMDRQHRDQGK